MSFEAVAVPPRSAGPGSGIQTIAVAMDRGATTILTGFISPHIAATLGRNGIEVIMPVAGRVMDVVETYTKGGFSGISGEPPLCSKPAAPSSRSRFQAACTESARQFYGLIPVLK